MEKRRGLSKREETASRGSGSGKQGDDGRWRLPVTLHHGCSIAQVVKTKRRKIFGKRQAQRRAEAIAARALGLLCFLVIEIVL